MAGLLERVRLVNERDELTHRVTEVRVFGSYLSDKASGTILGARKAPPRETGGDGPYDAR